MTLHHGGHAVRHDGSGPLHVEHAGAGPDVVLIHAGVADSRMWEPQWAAWQTRFALTRLDLRGFGRSGSPVGSFSHAADVLDVLDAAAIERALVVGASFGGLVALDLAAAHPGRVAGLVLADPPLPGTPWSEEMRGFFAAEEEALEAGDLEAATDVNVEFWLPTASEPVRAAIREQQLNAFRLQTDRAGRLAPHRGPARRPADTRRGDARRHGRARQGRLPGDRRPSSRRPCRTRGAWSSQAPVTCRASSGPRTSTRSCSRSSRAVHEEHAAGARPAATEVDQGREGSPTAFQK